jgi:phosphoglycolate phosphatase-like HAD superfamily hydrolase
MTLEAEVRRSINVFFDVDHTLVYVSQSVNALRPGAHDAMRRIKDAGHGVYVWSAGGKDYVERIVDLHGLREWVDGCFDKDPRVQPYPDFIIDDDWYLVEKYGGHCVSQYKSVNDADREFHAALDVLEQLGHL